MHGGLISRTETGERRARGEALINDGEGVSSDTKICMFVVVIRVKALLEYC